jgi:hypothetical protein
MKKIVRLTERDLTRIVKRVIKESNLSPYSDEDMAEDERLDRISNEWRDSFYDAFDFDFEGAFPEYNKESDKFDDNLNDFIVDMMGEDPEHAVRVLRKEPWFRPYVKYLR